MGRAAPAHPPRLHPPRAPIPPMISPRSAPQRRPRRVGRCSRRRPLPGRRRTVLRRPGRSSSAASGTPPPSIPRSAPPGTSGSWPATGGRRDNGVAREFEVALQSALDPYSSTKIFLTFENEEVGVEEGYIYWTGLPGRLRVDVGKFRQQLGDLNRWHLHALPETEYPLVYQRFLAPEGLAGVGLSLYTGAARFAAGGDPRGLAPGHHRRERPAATPAATSRRCSSGCRTSGSSTARPTPSSASPAPAATTTTRISGAGCWGSISA